MGQIVAVEIGYERSNKIPPQIKLTGRLSMGISVGLVILEMKKSPVSRIRTRLSKQYTAKDITILPGV